MRCAQIAKVSTEINSDVEAKHEGDTRTETKILIITASPSAVCKFTERGRGSQVDGGQRRRRGLKIKFLPDSISAQSRRED